MAGSIPYTRIFINNTAVDAASYVNSEWIEAGDLNQRVQLLSLEVDIATQAILYKVLSTSSSGATPYATIALNAGATIPINEAYGFDTFIGASVYMNFQFSATTTMKEFWAIQRNRW